MKRTLRIVPTLSTVIGVFVLITAVSILFVEFRASQMLLRDLGRDLITQSMTGLSLYFDTKKEDVEEQARFIAKTIETGGVLLDDQQSMSSFLYGTLAGTPQTSDAWVLDKDGNALEISRGDGDGIFIPRKVSAGDLPALEKAFKKGRELQKPNWSTPIYFPDRGETYFIHTHPVIADGDFYALVLIGVSIQEVSRVAKRLSDDDLTVFMTSGDFIVAHPDIEQSISKLSTAKPFPTFEEGPDPFLASYKSFQRVDSERYGLEAQYEVYFGETADGQERFMVLHKPPASAQSSLDVGIHFDADTFTQPFFELVKAAFVGVAILVLALACSLLLARWIARPIRRAATNARQVADFQLDAIEPLPESPIRELNDLASGFNSMTGVLNAFVRYVPRALVRRMVSEGMNVSALSERQLAVMFTDIAGFTSVSEKMGAVETAEFINHHLTLVGNAIYEHNGTIDKYIGDSVMAFWGAPENVKHPEEQAVRAALAIADAIKADNRRRAERGLPAVRIRIGFHVGPLVVGDIGAPSRVNYTVLGDTVNIASRLENLGREVDPDAEVVILTSQDSICEMSAAFVQVEEIGERTIKGKDETVNVVRILV